MLKVLRNLKESALSVIAIVLLLIIQASADLALPDYTSKIVNVGIQQSGIENSSPKAIRKNEMENILLFSNEDDEILQNYILVKSDSSKDIENGDITQKDYDKYLKEYPILEKEDLYVLKKISTEETEKLDDLISKPIMAYSTLTSEQYSAQMKEQMLTNVPEPQKTIMSQMSVLEIIKNMNEDQLNTLLVTIDEKLDSLSGSILDQAAISAVKSEYEAIGIDMTSYQNKYLILVGLQMLGIAFASMAAAISIMLLSSRVAAKLGKSLREKVFSKVLSFSNKEFREFSTASLITRSTNDIQQIQQLLSMLFRVVVYAPIVGIGGFLRVLNNSNTSMAWIIGLAIIIILGIVIILFIVAMPKFKKLQTLIDKVNGVSREILTGIPVIRAFSREKYEEDRFEVENKKLMKANVFVNNAMSLMMPALTLVMNGISLLIIWVGGHNVDSGVMQVGDMMAFIQYTMQIVMSFLMISMISIMLPRASVSANRINEILETENSIKDPKNPKKLNENKKGLVEFKNVSFKYPDADENILTNIDFTAKPGEITAIIGSTGSGKSTVVNLIPRFYDVTDGELLIDGVNVKDITQKNLRDIIGFVPQKGVLFSGTIESNIKYSNENMSDKQMENAAQIAQATEFIEVKQEKYKLEIAQGGNNVSGGQKQRLSIARAIAKDPEIFVFDDSFSALDFKTDSKLREALKEKTEGKTVIIIAQRISTILDADQIIVLDDGKIVGKGTHSELMKSSEVYRQIALSQLSGEELEK